MEENLNPEHSKIMEGWQIDYCKALNDKLRQFTGELDKLQSLHPSSEHTHPSLSYDSNTFNTHYNRINGYKSLLFEITVDNIREYITNSFTNIKEILSDTISIKNDTRLTKTFVFHGLFMCYYPDLNQYVLALHYTINNEKKILYKEINTFQELHDLLYNKYLTYIINLLTNESFYTSTKNYSDIFMGEFKVRDVSETSPEKLVQSDSLDKNNVVYNDTNWLNTWNVTEGGKTIPVDNKTKVVNGKGSSGKNYYITKNKASNNNAGFRTALARDEFTGEVKVRTVTETSTEKLIASNQTNNSVAYYNDTNWLNTWNVTEGGKTIPVDNKTKVVNGKGSSGKNYYITKNKASNNNAGFRVVSKNSEIFKKGLNMFKSGFNGHGFYSNGKFGNESPIYGQLDGFKSSIISNSSSDVILKAYFIVDYSSNTSMMEVIIYIPEFNLEFTIKFKKNQSNFNWRDSVFFAHSSLKGELVKKYPEGANYNWEHYAIFAYDCYMNGTVYDKYNKGKRSCDIYEGQYRSRWNKYNKGKRSCELWEGRYEGKYNITFNNNINTYNTRFNDTLLTFNKESNYLNSLLNRLIKNE